MSCRYGFFCICKKIAPLKKGATVKMLLFVCFVVVIAGGLCGILAIGRSGITVFADGSGCTIIKRFAVHKLVEILAVNLLMFHKVMSDLVKLISVVEQYLLCVFVACVYKFTDLAVNFCRNVFGVVSALRTSSL